MKGKQDQDNHRAVQLGSERWSGGAWYVQECVRHLPPVPASHNQLCSKIQQYKHLSRQPPRKVIKDFVK